MPQSGEDTVFWLGRIFGYWTPMTSQEFNNFSVPRYSCNIVVYYGGLWNWITGFESLELLL